MKNQKNASWDSEYCENFRKFVKSAQNCGIVSVQKQKKSVCENDFRVDKMHIR